MDESERQERIQALNQIYGLTCRRLTFPIGVFKGYFDDDELAAMARSFAKLEASRKSLRVHLKTMRKLGRWRPSAIETHDFRGKEHLNVIAESEEIQYRVNRLVFRVYESERKCSNDKMLSFLGFIVPRRHRETLIGDIQEDVSEMRSKGISETGIRAFICWQLLIVLKERTKRFAGLGFALWAYEKVRGFLGSYLGG